VGKEEKIYAFPISLPPFPAPLKNFPAKICRRPGAGIFAKSRLSGGGGVQTEG
jgi:hypothetical protein